MSSLKYMFMLGTVFLLSGLPKNEATIRCFECKDMYKPYFCDTVTLCADNEECFIDQFVTSGGQTLYNSGCRSQQRCGLRKRDIIYKNDTVSSHNDVFDDVTIPEDSSSDIITCQSCCNDSNFCNYQGCGQTPLFREQRGPYCFDCTNQDEGGCRHVTHCDFNYACEISSKTIDTFTLYDSRCVHITPTSRCNTTYKAPYTQQIAIGKRGATSDLCFKCCDEDFCNFDCSYGPNPPIDGGVTDWTPWSSCSGSCGNGSQSRSRACSNPTPSYGGTPCNKPLSEVRQCSDSPCPTDLPIITTWTQWTKCTVTCGPSGIQHRNKVCFSGSNPTPDLSLCQEPVYERRDCNEDVSCPVDGQWGEWSTWSPCPVTCGNGTQNRKRLCDSPVPKYGGTECEGNSTEQRICGGTPCPIKVNGGWGHWQTWSQCSKTCGNGHRTRTRTCTRPSPANGGQDCHGNGAETETCHHNCQNHICSHSHGYSLRTYHVPQTSSTHKICIKIYNISSTWYAARSQCMQDGADLLTFTSQNNHLNHVFARLPTNHDLYWIGLQYGDGTWNWVDGSKGLGSFGQSMLASHFQDHITNYALLYNGYKACIVDSGTYWLPRDCVIERHPFVCEKHGHFN